MSWPPDSDANDVAGEAARSIPGGSAADNWIEMLTEAETDRAARLDRLRADIEAGRYQVPSEAVADAILSFFTRRDR